MKKDLLSQEGMKSRRVNKQSKDGYSKVHK